MSQQFVKLVSARNSYLKQQKSLATLEVSAEKFLPSDDIVASYNENCLHQHESLCNDDMPYVFVVSSPCNKINKWLIHVVSITFLIAYFQATQTYNFCLSPSTQPHVLLQFLSARENSLSSCLDFILNAINGI